MYTNVIDLQMIFMSVELLLEWYQRIVITYCHVVIYEIKSLYRYIDCKSRFVVYMPDRCHRNAPDGVLSYKADHHLTLGAILAT